MIIVNDCKPLTIITKRSVLDVAAVLDPPLEICMQNLENFGNLQISKILNLVMYNVPKWSDRL